MYEIDWTAFWTAMQAVGTVVAIAAAIWIGDRQTKRSEQVAEGERKRQAAIVAAGLATALYTLKLETEVRLHVFRQMLARLPPSGNYTLARAEPLLEEMQLKDLPPLASMLAWTSVLDKEVGQLALLVTESAATIHRNIEKVLRSFTRGLSVEAARIHIEQTIGRLGELQTKIDQTMSLLSPIHQMERDKPPKEV